MLSEPGQRIRGWLFENIKNAPPAATVDEARARIAAFGGRSSLTDEIKIQLVDEGDFAGEWVSFGEVHEDKVILFFHGGGYIMGSCQSSRGLVSQISHATQCPVLSAEYRLAPEHPFPAALEDAVAAYKWLTAQGTLPENIILIGESAGGGLALASLLSLRDSNTPLPAGAVLICPWTDLTGSVASRTTKIECDPWFNADSIDAQAGQLYAGQTSLKNPLVSPLYAELQNLPPILIQAASDDTLLDDSVELYTKAKAAGLDITLQLWEGMWHVWHNFSPAVPEATEAINKIGEYVQQKLRIA